MVFNFENIDIKSQISIISFVKQILYLYEQKIQRNCDNNFDDGICNISHWSGNICMSSWFKNNLESRENSDFCNRYFYNLSFRVIAQINIS